MTPFEARPSPELTAGSGASAVGWVVGVQGTVIEIEFPDDLPALGAALQCQRDGEPPITAVVHAHLHRSTVQAIAVDATRGVPGGRPTCRSSWRASAPRATPL